MKVSEIKALMARYGLRPNKGLGQNFLVDATYLEKIVRAAAVREDEVVLEIGPGLGPLTERLLEVARHVIAVELDKGFIHILQDRFGAISTFSLHHRDILETEIVELLAPVMGAGEPRYTCVANIPYYITSAVMRHLLEAPIQPERIVLLMQREVAQRITAAPGDLSLLAIAVQFYGQPEIVDIVPAGAFYPAPSVDSAILRVIPYPERRYTVADAELFWEVVKAGFGQKRKQLKNSLQAGLPRFSAAQVASALDAATIASTRRAQTLAIAEWVTLYEAFERLRMKG